MSKENKQTPAYLVRFIKERKRIKSLPISPEEKRKLNREARYKFYEERTNHYEREPTK
jgi:hypothetical protein